MFPAERHRRLRQSAFHRILARETELQTHQLIMPFFVVPGRGVRNPITSMPGQFQISVDVLLKELSTLVSLGIKSILLFGIPKKKDLKGTDATSSQGIVQQAVRAIKKKFPSLIVFTDLCFCEYTTHGHCGAIRKNKRGQWDVDNDATLKMIEKAAVAQAQAGADFIAPSGMMDGTVGIIRRVLDKKGFQRVGILSYSAKYASVFYGPFREAAGSRPQFGDRKTYQMDPSNAREALKEINADVEEGADMVMIKPALSYMDIIRQARLEVKVPVVAYNVSGEYAMIKAAEQRGWLDGASECRAACEVLTSLKRAGADLIITYHAMDVARVLNKSERKKLH